MQVGYKFAKKCAIFVFIYYLTSFSLIGTSLDAPSNEEIFNTLRTLIDFVKSDKNKFAQPNLYKDNEEISKLYQKAIPTKSSNGDPKAQKKLASIYFSGSYDFGVAKNINKSLYWSSLCATQSDDADCAYMLGAAFLAQGNMLNRAAVVLLWKAAFWQNHLYSIYSLGLCYEMGLGLPKNLRLAAEFYRDSADRNLPQGMLKYAGLLLEGESKNYREALQYLNGAESHGLSVVEYKKKLQDLALHPKPTSKISSFDNLKVE